MGWAKSASTGRRKTSYQVSMPTATPVREPPITMIGSSSKSSAATTQRPAPVEGQAASPKRDRRPLPVYDVATGEDLETPVNLDNTLLQVMFPDLEIALGQVPPPPPGSSPEQVEAHWQAVLADLPRDLGDQDGSARHGAMALDIATGARKEGRFVYTDGQVGRSMKDVQSQSRVCRRTSMATPPLDSNSLIEA
jgi:hypothetical protein